MACGVVILGIPQVFLKILHEVKWFKTKTSDEAKILKKILELPPGAKMVHLGPKNSIFQNIS